MGRLREHLPELAHVKRLRHILHLDLRLGCAVPNWTSRREGAALVFARRCIAGSSLCDPALDLGEHLLVGQLDLLLNEHVRLLVHRRGHFCADLLALLQLRDLILFLAVVGSEHILQLLLLGLLSCDALLRLLELVLDLLRLRERVELQAPALAPGLEVGRDVREDDPLAGLHLHGLQHALRLRHVVRVEDLVLAERQGGYGLDEPLLVGEVAPAHVDAALQLADAEVLLHLLDQDQFGGRPGADAKCHV